MIKGENSRNASYNLSSGWKWLPICDLDNLSPKKVIVHAVCNSPRHYKIGTESLKSLSLSPLF